MRFFIIRHGDPDYLADNLTPRGKKEAALLAERLKQEGISRIVCSPLGRAQATAAPTAELLGIEPETLEWLHEYPTWVEPPYVEHGVCAWELLPHYWSKFPDCRDLDAWPESEPYRSMPDNRAVFDRVRKGADALLREEGFTREGTVYRMTEEAAARTDAVAVFCHMGLGLLLLSHLLSIPAPMMWHNFFLAPSSVSTVLMETHNNRSYNTARDICIPRALAIGECSHLYAGGESPASVGISMDRIR